MSDFHFSPRPNRAHDIAWRPWGAQAFAEAKSADKPILLSLSATWCHWCHVMDETSYSNPDVVAAINEAYIPIRVDADQRPDVNARYNAGGWPTTAFLTHEGDVLTAQTYVPPEAMQAIMRRVLDAYQNHRADVFKTLAHKREHLSVRRSADDAAPLCEEIISATRRTIEDAFDEEYGGFGDEPKFPQTDILDFIASEWERTRDGRLERILSKTLRAMAHGGSYDHIEGGFFRYSTTRDWSIPHFEKMAEDHAGLIRVYARAWRAFGTPALRETLLSALSYLRTTLHDPDTGLFAGSQDADEAYYACTLEERRALPAPFIDRTSYTGWTAALAGAYAAAGNVLADDLLIAEALHTLDAIATLMPDARGLCYHVLAPGESPRICNQLNDQSSYLRALLDVYEISGESRLLHRALALAETVNDIFAGEDGTLADHAGEALGMLAVRMTPLPENASVADSFLRLSVITAEDRYRGRAERILRAFAGRYAAYRTFAAPYASAVSRYLHGGANVTIVGSSEASTLLRETARRLPDPFLVVATLPEEDPFARARGLRAMLGTPAAYVCRGTACAAPVTSPADLREAFDSLLAVR